MSDHSTRKPRSRKSAKRPKKPYPEFPLTPHASGKWMKKIRGKIHYFGRWANRVDGKLVRLPEDGWKEALAQYEAEVHNIHLGRPKDDTRDALTVADLCNRFLTGKLRKCESGELGPRMFQDYKDTTDLIVATFEGGRYVEDLKAEDFERLRATMTKRWGPVRLANMITRVKSVFKYAAENELVDRPVRYGSEFKKPDKAVMRRHRARAGERMLEAAELRLLLDALAGKEVTLPEDDQGGAEAAEPKKVKLDPDLALRAMVLLGLNCGLGNHDCAVLSQPALDLDAAWLDFPRPKTGVPRRCPLWPETVTAIRAALAARPAPRDPADADAVFLLRTGRRWVRNTEKSRTDNLSGHLANVMKALGLHREGLNFYTLRHVFRTVADAARDPVAIDLIMGHTDPSMGGHYRERIEDSRLVAVAESVRRWLFDVEPDGRGTGPKLAAMDKADLAEDAAEAPNERPSLRLFAG